LRLPAEGQNLVRASIIDNTDRKRAEQALRESEEKFRALFEGSSQGVVLHDENQILEVNPAAVRIMGCQSPAELLGKHPGETSPPFQPNGESSAVLARKYIQECLSSGSARFEWVSRTRRQRVQRGAADIERGQVCAFSPDSCERAGRAPCAKRSGTAPKSSRTRAEESLNQRVHFHAGTEVALARNAGTELQAMPALHRTAVRDLTLPSPASDPSMKQRKLELQAVGYCTGWTPHA
jgi:PAS domain S-box-containing protein